MNRLALLSTICEAREEAESVKCTHAAIDLEAQYLCDIEIQNGNWDIQMKPNGIFWFRVDLHDDFILQAARLHLKWLRRQP